MDKQNQTAGETATTNQFDAEIVRLKQERDERINDIKERIDRLTQQNHDMKVMRNLNQEQIGILNTEKELAFADYKRRIAAIVERKDDYYCSRISSTHYKRFQAFCDLHPEVLQMWREFRQAEEGGEQ